jgi:uncharacterized membrane protein
MLGMRSELSPRTAVGLVLAAALIGAFFRFYELGAQSLWLDEIATAGPGLFASSFFDAYWHHINLHPTPPLYTVFLMGWSALTGFSEAALRLPSAIMGMAAVVVFYGGLRRVFDANLSAAAAILMALSWPAIYYSQEVRAYSAVLLFTTLAAVLWMRILKDLANSETRGADWTKLFIASVLAALTHPFGFIITGFQWLYLFFAVLGRRNLAIRAALFGTGFFVVYLGWFIPNTFGIAKVIAEDQLYFNRPGLWFFVHIGAFLFHHPVVAVLTSIIPLGLGAAPYGKRLLRLIRAWDFTAPEIYLPFMLAAPFLFSFAVAQIKPFMYSRHLIVFLPFIFVFVAYVLSCRRWRYGVTQPLLIFVLAVTSCYWIFRDYYIPDKPQNRELAQFALAAAGEDALIAIPCEAEVRFECLLGPGKSTNPRWSKYIYYLNRGTLPRLPVMPETFRDRSELAAIVARSRELGKRRIVLMGSRGNVGMVEEALEYLQSSQFDCQTKEFHLALGAVCGPISS